MLRKKILLLACVFASVAAMAAPATANYFCDFEDDTENAQWITWEGSTVSRMKHSTWKTGGAAFYIGRQGMYITDLEIAEDNTHSYPKSSGYSVTAYRKMTLDAGSYTISLDYRCPSELLSVSLINADTLAANAIQTQTGADYAATVKGAILDGMRDMKSTKWAHASVLHQVTTAGTYLLAITYRTSTGPDLDFGAAVDNVEVVRYQPDQTACDYVILGMRLEYEDGHASLTWKGNAEEYEVRCYDPEGEMIFTDTVNDLGAVDSCRFAIETVIPGVYQFMVRGLGCGGNGATTGWGYCRVDITTRIAVACPEVALLSPIMNVVNGEKCIYPSCEGTDTIRLKSKVVAGGGEIRGYRVDQVLYEDCPFPFSYAEASQMMASSDNYIRRISTDDVWDNQALTLPFKVCFFNNTYSQAVVCSNGIVSFDRNVVGQSAGYSLTGQPDIPSSNFGGGPGTGMFWRNAIYGVFQDYDPHYGGEIWYGVLGEWPCRKMVVCWNQVPMYNNHSTINSSMIVMYEGTNVIDVYVKNRDLSPSGWNDNRGIIGIQNSMGTDGLAAPGRNTTAGDQNGRSWTAHEEAWRFSPIATPEYSVTWYKGAFNDADEIDAYIAAHPEENIIIEAEDSLDVLSSDNIDAVTIRLQYSLCNGDPIDLLDQARIVWPRPTNVLVDTAICYGQSYADEYVQVADTSGVYDVIIPDFRGCDSLVYKLNLRVLPIDTVETNLVICDGESIDYENMHLDHAGVFPVIHKYAACNCDSVLENVNVSVLEKLTAGIVEFPDQVCGDDSILSFALAASIPGLHYSVHIVPEGSGFEDITNAEIDDVADVLVRMSQNVYPGYYTMYVDVEEEACGAAHDSIHFVVNYPASIAPQKWGNVLVLLATEVNGGYTFSNIQWYRNGEPIEGATGPYYYAGEGEKFDKNTTYTVGLVRQGETYEIQSCALGDLAVSTDVDTQTLDPNVLPMQLDGRMIVYDVLGRVVANEAYDYNRLMAVMARGQQGIYLVKVMSPVGNQVYRLYNSK